MSRMFRICKKNKVQLSICVVALILVSLCSCPVRFGRYRILNVGNISPDVFRSLLI